MRAYIIPSMAQKDSHKDGGGQVGVITRTEPKTKKPSLYKVLLKDAERTSTAKIVERLMGNKPEERFNFISERAEFVSEEGLDI
jgi:topoisomerase-4 subunit B